MHVPHLRVLLTPISTTTQSCIFEWGPEQKEAMYELQNVVGQLSVPLEPCDPPLTGDCGMSATCTHTDWGLWQKLVCTSVESKMESLMSSSDVSSPRIL